MAAPLRSHGGEDCIGVTIFESVGGQPVVGMGEAPGKTKCGGCPRRELQRVEPWNGQVEIEAPESRGIAGRQS